TDAYPSCKKEGHRHGALPAALAVRGDPPRVQIFAPAGPALCPPPPRRDGARPRQAPTVVLRSVCHLAVVVFFHPVVTSLRGLQQTTTLANVQERLGLRQTSLRALSEAAYVFDAALLHAVLTTLGARLRPHLPLAQHEAARHL